MTDNLEIGTPGYYAIGGDVYPVTLVRISKNKKVVYVQFDKFRAAPGHDYYGEQKWQFERNKNGRIDKFNWSEKRQKYSQDGCGAVRFGSWAAKQDPHF